MVGKDAIQVEQGWIGWDRLIGASREGSRVHVGKETAEAKIDEPHG